MLTGTSDPDIKELFRSINAAVTDMPQVPYSNPYAVRDPSRPLVEDLGALDKLIDPRNTVNVLLGVGPYAPTQCNIAWCKGKPLSSATFGLFTDIGDQVREALLAVRTAPN